jgi:hypothetical protein
LPSWQAGSGCTWVQVAALLQERSLFVMPQPSSVSRPLPRTHLSRYGRLRHSRLCRKLRLLTDGAPQSRIASRDAVPQLASKCSSMAGSSLELDTSDLHASRRRLLLRRSLPAWRALPSNTDTSASLLGVQVRLGRVQLQPCAGMTLQYTSTTTSMATRTRGWVGKIWMLHA